MHTWQVRWADWFLAMNWNSKKHRFWCQKANRCWSTSIVNTLEILTQRSWTSTSPTSAGMLAVFWYRNVCILEASWGMNSLRGCGVPYVSHKVLANEIYRLSIDQHSTVLASWLTVQVRFFAGRCCKNHDFFCFNSSQKIILPTGLSMYAYRHWFECIFAIPMTGPRECFWSEGKIRSKSTKMKPANW